MKFNYNRRNRIKVDLQSLMYMNQFSLHLMWWMLNSNTEGPIISLCWDKQNQFTCDKLNQRCYSNDMHPLIRENWKKPNWLLWIFVDGIMMLFCSDRWHVTCCVFPLFGTWLVPSAELGYYEQQYHWWQNIMLNVNADGQMQIEFSRVHLNAVASSLLSKIL